MPMVPVMQQERFATALAAEFQADGIEARGEIGNVGPGGLFVEARSIPETGEMVRVGFDAPDGQRILVDGIVWWTSEDRPGFGRKSGFGIRLLDAPARYESFVEKLGEQQRAQQGRQQARAAATRRAFRR
jgi:hypothetical protein